MQPFSSALSHLSVVLDVEMGTVSNRIMFADISVYLFCMFITAPINFQDRKSWL